MKSFILVFNAGSSSLKFAVFETKTRVKAFHGIVDDIPKNPVFKVYNHKKECVFHSESIKTSLESAVEHVFAWYKSNVPYPIDAIGHRVVHGGAKFTKPVKINKSVIEKLKTLIPLAPLHQPYNIKIIEYFANELPNTVQVACFDTNFHTTQKLEAKLLPIPYKYYEDGVMRYGFHGLSYEYISSVMPNYLGEDSNKKVVVAHLGNGASICAMHERKSIATSMGFSSIGGLMMGTRCGDIDPGVLLYLMENNKMSVEEITRLIYKESGLQGISGISYNMRELLASKEPRAKIAIDLYCYNVAGNLLKLTALLNGLDSIIFTAGIGENSPEIRGLICSHLKWVGVELDKEANESNKTKISSVKSNVGVYVIPTDEEQVLANHTAELFAKKTSI